MASFVKISNKNGDEYVNMDNVLFFVEGNNECKLHFIDGSTKGFRDTSAKSFMPPVRKKPTTKRKTATKK